MAPDTVRFEVSGLDLGSFPEAGAITKEMLMRSVFEEFYLHIDDAADDSLQPVSVECLNFIFDGHSVMQASEELLKSAAKCISGESGHLESRKQLKETVPLPEPYDDILIFVRSRKELVKISEGADSNLLPEDIEEGCVDYLYISQYSADDPSIEAGGGDLMLTEPVREKYCSLKEAIPEVLDYLYDDAGLEHIVLE